MNTPMEPPVSQLDWTPPPPIEPGIVAAEILKEALFNEGRRSWQPADGQIATSLDYYREDLLLDHVYYREISIHPNDRLAAAIGYITDGLLVFAEQYEIHPLFIRFGGVPRRKKTQWGYSMRIEIAADAFENILRPLLDAYGPGKLAPDRAILVQSTEAFGN